MRWLRSLLLLLTFASPSLALATSPGLRAVTASPRIGVQPPLCISLVGSAGGVPASASGEFVIVALDQANHPIPGAVVTVDLSGCLDLSICADQLDPAATVDCAAKTVRKVAAADGSVRFTLLGGSNGAGNASTLLGGGRVFVNGLLYWSPTVSVYDLDGSGGLGANDLSAWLGDYGSGLPFGRSDYDCSDSLGANDLSLWLAAFGSGAMSQSCVSQCP